MTADPTAPMTGDLRDQIAEALYEWTLKAVGVRSLIPPDEASARENSRSRADAVMAVLVSLADPGDLPQRMAWEIRNTECGHPGDGGACSRCRAEAALSVRWETAIQAYAAAGEALRRERYAVAEHKGTQERLAEARRELAQYRARLAARITDEVGLSWQELLDRAEQLRVERDAQIQRAEVAEHEITRVEGFCRDQRQRADRAAADLDAAIADHMAERTALEEQVAALQRELAEARESALREAAADCRRAITGGSYGPLAQQVADEVEKTLIRLAQATTEEKTDG